MAKSKLQRPTLKRRAADSTQRWCELFEDYLRSECRLAENTVEAYRRDLRRFRQWLGRRSVPSLSITQLSAFVAWLHEQELAPATVARHLVALKMFFRFLQLEGLLQKNQAELLGSQTLWERIPEVLSPEKVTQFLEAPRRFDRFWHRDRALLELLYATGCRASEMSDLLLRDVHLDQGFCQCQGKGSKQRLTPIGRPAAAAVRDYLEHQRPQLAAAASSPPLRGCCCLAAAGGCAARRSGPWSRSTRDAAASRWRSARTRCGTVLPRTCWPAAPTCGRCRRCSATPASPRRRSIRTWTAAVCSECTASSTPARSS